MRAIIGIGNPLRKDDNIGNIVSERVGGMVGYQNPENLIGKLDNPKTIVFIDAVEFEGRVGEVRLFDMDEIADEMATTHNVPAGIFQKFFPKAKLKVIGIKVEDRSHGDGLSGGLDIERIVTSAQGLLDSL